LYNYAIQSWHIDEDSAWDIIYIVLFKITERINEYSFKNENQFRNMLYSIFNNELINFYHKSKRIEERLKFLSFDDSLSSSPVNENSNSINREVNETIFKSALEEFWSNPQADNPLLNCLNDLLDELEDWERILVNQRSMGFSYSEIATYIDKPENQLKVYFARLKSKIQTKLIEKMNDNKDE
jgi:RNA polymerase sigma factor (sigma-70 family)